MKNTPKTGFKGSISKHIKAISTIGAAIVIILAAKANPVSAAVQKEVAEIFKKNPDKEIIVKVESEQENTENVAKFETLGNDPSNALTFATQNVDKYYPDMKEHLTTMMNSFRDEEHQSATIKLLDEMVVNITDPAQKTGAIILALEFVFRGNTIFSDTYDADITDETFSYIETFDTDYKTRFKEYYAKLLNETDILKQEIAKNEEELKKTNEELKQSQERFKQSQENLKKSLQELEATLSKFSPDDVKNND